MLKGQFLDNNRLISLGLRAFFMIPVVCLAVGCANDNDNDIIQRLIFQQNGI